MGKRLLNFSSSLPLFGLDEFPITFRADLLSRFRFPFWLRRHTSTPLRSQLRSPTLIRVERAETPSLIPRTGAEPNEGESTWPPAAIASREPQIPLEDLTTPTLPLGRLGFLLF